MTVFFFDIDNCLYSQSSRIHELMGDRIRQYIEMSLKVSPDEAEHLHQRYYKDYGLAIEGLVRHHEIDALDYNSKVDDQLPLESILSRNPQLISLLGNVKTGVKLWLFTNAYVNHAERVTRILGVREFFDGVTFCDYRECPLLCKPMPRMFEKAMQEAGVTENDECWYVDDSRLNVCAAADRGWHCVHLDESFKGNEPQTETTEAGNSYARISSLLELPQVFGELFKADR